MKVKLLMLCGMTVVPLLAFGQSNTTFYNKGKMSIVGSNPANTILYVEGDFVVDRDATDPNLKSEIHTTSSRTVITGDFYQNADYEANTEANAFVPDAASVVEFRGTTPQNITTRYRINGATSLYNAERKGANFINFPSVEVNNSQHVTIAPEIAANVQSLNLTKGKLILDSRRIITADGIVPGRTGTVSHDANNSSLLAHLQVDGTVNYNRTTASTLDDFGVVQVKVALDETNAAVETNGRSLVGMGSPFQEIRSDYFMYNFLMFPYDNNIFGEYGFTETNPTTVIPAGKGFVVGIDLRGTDASKYNTDADEYAGKRVFADRAKDGYTFDRFAFNNGNNIYPLSGYMNNAFSQVSSTNGAYANENLNISDVSMTLKAGYNYLANPFTAPLSVEALLVESNVSAGATPWGNVSVGPSADVINQVWVLNPSSRASGLYNLSNGGQTPISYPTLWASWTYLNIKRTGGTFVGTYTDGGGNDAVIAPLQMFLVYASRNGANITIPASERSIGSASHFLRSAANNSVYDDFVFEVGDKKTSVYDRTAVVIRTPDQIMANPNYLNVKKILSSVVDESDTRKMVSTIETGTVNNNVNSVLYTKDTEGNALESYFLPAADGSIEKTTTLYLSPSKIAQDITIRALRVNSKKRVESIWLKDNLKNKEIELSSENEYTTSVNPSDAPDRFTLRFVFDRFSNVGNEEQQAAKAIESYYANGELTVTGFEDVDLGSTISIYDIQGRMLKQAKVNQLTMNIPATLASGAYIVKVIGNKSYVSKFLAR